MPSNGTHGFCKPFFRNCRCPLRASLTVLSKLMNIISKKLSNYSQISEHLLHFIPIIIEIIISRLVDNKRSSFIIKYMVQYTKLFLFFNPSFQGMYFLYVLSGLSPQILMTYLYKYSSDAHAISMGFNMKWYGDNRRTELPTFSGIESMAYYFLIFLKIIFSNNTDLVGIIFRISILCFGIKAITSSFFR